MKEWTACQNAIREWALCGKAYRELTFRQNISERERETDRQTDRQRERDCSSCCFRHLKNSLPFYSRLKGFLINCSLRGPSYKHSTTLNYSCKKFALWAKPHKQVSFITYSNNHSMNTCSHFKKAFCIGDRRSYFFKFISAISTTHLGAWECIHKSSFAT